MADRKNTAQETHNHAQKQGSSANFVDKIAHAIERPLRSGDYKKGYDNGVKNPKK